MSLARLCIAVVFVAVVTACGASASNGGGEPPVYDTEAGFTFTPPPGLTRIDPPPGAAFNYVFASPEMVGQIPAATVGIQRMSGTIGPEVLTTVPDNAPPGSTLATMQWQGVSVGVIRSSLTTNGVQMVVRGAQLPLATRAVQVFVCVPADWAAAADPLLAAAVAGLVGPVGYGAAATPGSVEGGMTAAFIERHRTDEMMAVLVWVVALTVLFRPGIKSPPRGSGPATPAAVRHKRSAAIAAAVGVLTIAVTLVGTLLSIANGHGPPMTVNTQARMFLLTTGAVTLGGWATLLAYGLWRAAYRHRYGPVGTASASSGGDVRQ